MSKTSAAEVVSPEVQELVSSQAPFFDLANYADNYPGNARSWYRQLARRRDFSCLMTEMLKIRDAFGMTDAVRDFENTCHWYLWQMPWSGLADDIELVERARIGKPAFSFPTLSLLCEGHSIARVCDVETLAQWESANRKLLSHANGLYSKSGITPSTRGATSFEACTWDRYLADRISCYEFSDSIELMNREVEPANPEAILLRVNTRVPLKYSIKVIERLLKPRVEQEKSVETRRRRLRQNSVPPYRKFADYGLLPYIDLKLFKRWTGLQVSLQDLACLSEARLRSAERWWKVIDSGGGLPALLRRALSTPEEPD